MSEAIEGVGVSWDRRRELFSLDPAVAHLNHGSYGTVPIPVQRAQQRVRDELEANPMAFFTRGLFDRLAHTRRHLAAFVGADPDRTALVPNATAAVQVVLNSVDLSPGDEILLTDHGYDAVRVSAQRRAAAVGALVRVVAVPLTATDDEVVDLITGAVGPRTRLAIVDHVASPTARLFPVERLVPALRERDVLVLVDAAHAPGMLAVDVLGLGADFWLGNLHKWAFAPRPTALLSVAPPHRARMRSLVAAIQEPQGFPAAQEFAGTLDYTPWLAAPAGVHLLRTLGPDRVREHNGDLVARGQRLVADALADLDWPDPGRAETGRGETGRGETGRGETGRSETGWRRELELARHGVLGDPRVSMRLVPLPPGIASELASLVALRGRLASEYAVEAALVAWRGNGYVRLSAQIYNRVDEYERLAHALTRLLRAA